jgi:hypothetical protein
MPLVRPNNSVYDPNAITYQTGAGGGGIILHPINKGPYDTKPRIGWQDPNDTNSTNMTQQLLLEHQKQNDDKTKKMFVNYHKNIKDGFIAYHNNYYEPLLREYNNLQTDFDIYKRYPLPSNYTQELLNNNYNTNDNIVVDNTNFQQQNPMYDYTDIYKSNNNLDDKDTDYPILEPTHPNNFDTNNEDYYPLLESNNADNFSPPPFENFLSKHFDVETVDEDENENLNKKLSSFDIGEQPKNDALLEEFMYPQNLASINRMDKLRYINNNDKHLHIRDIPKDISINKFKKLINEKLFKKDPKTNEMNNIRGDLNFDLPASYLTDAEIERGKTILKTRERRSNKK